MIWKRLRNGTPLKTRSITHLDLFHRDNVTHYFSHIPKSGTEYAHGELLRLLKSTMRLPQNRTERQIALAQTRFNNTEFDEDFFAPAKVANYSRFPPIDLTGDTDYYTPPYICNHATTPFLHFPPYHTKHFSQSRFKIQYACAMSVSEMPWNHVAHNVYTIIREPFSHILSEYFHCTESNDHSKPKMTHEGIMIYNRTSLLPPLKEWLEIYAGVVDENLKTKAYNARDIELKKRFHCYTPINSETAFTKFPKVPDDYTYPYPMTEKDQSDRSETTKEIDKVLFDDLKKKYKVIGDMAQMVKTVCAIFIDFTEGKHIPEICDCTNLRVHDPGLTSFCLPNLWTNPHDTKVEPSNNPRAPMKKTCPIKIGYDSGSHAHGVKHHGSSYVKDLTPRERELISKLRSNDLVLYNVSRAVFQQQVEEMEERYGIQICDQWNPPEWAFEAPLFLVT